MTPSQKPEWIEIADADKAASVRRISKGLPVMALVAVAAILGVGVVAAQTQEQTPANAVESVVPSVQSDQVGATSDPAPVASTESVSMNTTNASTSVIASKESVAPKARLSSPALPNPSIGTMPTGGGDDDEGDDEDDEGDDD